MRKLSNLAKISSALLLGVTACGMLLGATACGDKKEEPADSAGKKVKRESGLDPSGGGQQPAEAPKLPEGAPKPPEGAPKPPDSAATLAKSDLTTKTDLAPNPKSDLTTKTDLAPKTDLLPKSDLMAGAPGAKPAEKKDPTKP